MSKSMKGGKRKASLTQPTVEERGQQPNGQVVIAPHLFSSIRRAPIGLGLQGDRGKAQLKTSEVFGVPEIFDFREPTEMSISDYESKSEKLLNKCTTPNVAPSSFRKQKWPSSLIIVAIIAISLSLITLFTYQGFVLFKPAEQFNESIDETFTSSQEYEWAPQHEGKLNSLWIVGSYFPGEEGGYARVVVSSFGINYTLFDSRATDEFSPTPITGFAIDEVNNTSGATNETSSNEPPHAALPVESIATEDISLSNNTPTGQNESVGQNTTVEESDMLEDNVTLLPPAENLTEPLSINLVLEYQSQTAFDEDNDGIATVKDAIDFTIAPTAFSAEPDSSKLCTIWTVENTQSSTKRCHGSTECCAFANLAPSSEKWDDAYYAAYNKDGAALENTIFAEVISYDVDMASSKANIDSSGKKSLPARFTTGEIAIEKSCKDACTLPGWNLPSYTLHIELSQGAILSLDSIGYLMEERVTTEPILLQNFSNMTLVKGVEHSINLSQYFADEDGDALQYSFYTMGNISIAVHGDAATIIPSEGFVGTQFTYLSATDGATTVTSNIFRIDVLESDSITERVEIGKKVVWSEQIPIEDISNDTLSFDIPESALNVSVSLISNTLEEQILPTKIAIEDNNESVSLGEFQEGQKIEQVAREISIIEEGQKRGSGLIILEGQNLSDDEFAKAIPKLKKEKKEREDKESSLSTVSKGKSEQAQIIPSTTEDNDTIATVVVENLSSIQPLVDTILVEYTTEAPIMVQTKTSQSTQEVNIYSNTHYENVSVGADIDDTPKESITLYWVQNGTKSEFTDVAYLDSNLNGLIDRLEWVVPHLSNQTFEISITVLNVQSYPIVGGNWEVRFVTTGTANLTISGFNETTYTEMEIDNASTSDDLLPKSLTCGNSTLYDFDSRYMHDTVWLVTGDNQTVKFGDVSSLTVPITSLFVQNYSCDNATASWVSQVKTPGKHHQRFTFGGQEAEAHNFAISSCTNFTQGDATYDLDTPIYQDFSSTCFKLNYSNIVLDGHGINITSTVAGAVVVNISANSSTLQNLNLTNAIPTTGLTLISGGEVISNIYNTRLINNKVNTNSGSDNYEIHFRSFNYNTSLINNTLTRGYSTQHSILVTFSGTTINAVIHNNNFTSGVGGGGNSGTGLSFQSAAHANNTVSYNIFKSTTTNERILGIVMTAGGQGNVFDHNIINLSTGGSYDAPYSSMGISGVNGGTYISNITLSNNQLYDNGGGNLRSNLRFTYISGSNAGVNVFSNVVSASGSGYTPLAALSATEVRNMRFWNNTWYTKNIGIYLNGTGSTAAVGIDTNITFINDTIAACTDNPACGSKNITSILLTENVTNVYMQDVRFNKTQIRIVSRSPGGESAEKNNIMVQWTFDMNVTRASNGQAIQTAFVQINDSKGQTLYNGAVNSLGAINSTLITEFTQNGTVVPFYQSCTEQTDETGDATANFSCHMPLKISVTDFGNAEVGFLFYLNQTNKTTVQMEVASVVAVGGCVNFTQGNTQYDLYAPIFQDFSSTCFKLNYTNITLDGHNFNITSTVAGAVVVNVTSNFSTVRGMNLTGAVSVTNSFKIYATGAIANLNVSNNLIYSQGTGSSNIEVSGNNVNVTIMGNRLAMPTATGTTAIYLNGPTTSAFITQNTINASSAAGNPTGVCIDFVGISSDHSTNIISYNNCTIPVAGGLGMRLVGTGNGNIIDHNIINYSSTATSTGTRHAVSLGGSSGNTPIRNMTISNNIIWTMTSGVDYNSLIMGVVDGRAEKSIAVYSNIIAMSGKSRAAFYGTSIKNIRFWNNTFYGRVQGIILNGTGNTAAGDIDTNITFINDTITACPDHDECSNKNLTPIVLTENVTNVFLQDVRFNKTMIKIVTKDPNGAETNNLTVQWTLDLNVSNLSNENSIPTALVQINNSKGQMIYNGTVNSLGAINSTLITEFSQNGTVVPFYQSCTEIPDERGNPLANFSCFMPLNISITAPGYIPVGFSYYLNQTNKTTVQIAIIDVTPPIVNTSFNISTFIKGNVLNYTANITDEYILSDATWSHNVSGFYVFVNYTLSGKTAQVSNFTTLPAGLFNFTITARDAFGNEKSNSTIIQVSTAHISNCTVLNETGVSYYLQNNVSTPVPTNGVCFNITSNSVTLDCQGRFVNGSDDGYGVWAEKVEGITIKNCSFWNWGNANPEGGIYFTQVGNSTIRNINSSLNARFGVYLDTSSMRNNITDIVVFSNTVGMGIYGDSNRISNIRAHSSINNEGVIIQSSFNTVSNITTYSNPTGLYIYGNYNNLSFVNASFNVIYSGIQVYSGNFNRFINVTASSNAGSGIIFSYPGQSGENFISNSTFQDNTLMDISFPDNSGAYCRNKFENITISGSYPFGYYNYSVNIANRVFSELILCNADGSNLTNITVVGSPTINNNGVFVTGVSGAKLSNINSSGNYMGILAYMSPSNTFVNTTAIDNTYGLNVDYLSNYNNFSNAYISGSTAGVYMDNNPNNNTFFNALIVNSTTGIRIDGSQNTFEFITLNKTTADAIAFADASVNATFKNSILAGCTGEGLDTSAVPTQLDFDYLANFSCRLGSIPKIYNNISLPVYPFAVANNGNFYLKPSSFAVDAGNRESIAAISPGGSVNLSAYYTSDEADSDTVDLGYHYPVSAQGVVVDSCRKLGSSSTYLLSANILQPILASNAPCFNVTANGVTLDCQGMFVNGSDDGYGVYAKNVRGITIKNCSFWNWGDGVFESGVYFESVSNSTISYVNSSINRWGIVFNSAASNNITESTLNSNNQYGAYLVNGGSFNRLTRVVADSNSGRGIMLEGSSQNTLSNITVRSNPDGLYLYLSSQNTVTNITAQSNSNYGVTLAASSASNAFKNVLSQNGIYNLVVDDSDKNNFTSFSLSDGSSAGILLGTSPNNNTFSNAVIANTPIGVQLSGIQNTFEFITLNKTSTDAIAFEDASVNATFKNSILSGCSGEGIDTGFAPTQLNFNYIANYSCTLGNVPKIYYNYSLTAYPFDKRATNGNFYLNQSLATINRGERQATATQFPDGTTLNSYYTGIDQDYHEADLGYHYFEAAQGINFSTCQVLSTPGKTYNLTANITQPTLPNDGVCMNITANGVTLDCQGKFVTGSLNGYAVLAKDVEGITIRNCSLLSWGDGTPEGGIYFLHVGNSTIRDVNASLGRNGIYLNTDSSYNNLTNIVVKAANNIGLTITYANFNKVTNIEAADSGEGIVFNVANYNTLSFANAHGNQWGIDIYSSNGNNLTNVTASSNSVAGLNLDGSNLGAIVANSIKNSTFQSNTRYDISFQFSSGTPTTICNSLFENITLSGSNPFGYYNSSVSIANRSFSELVLCNAQGSNLTNINVDGSPSLPNNGIFLLLTANATLSNVTSSNNYAGLYAHASSYNKIINFTANSNVYGMYLTSTSGTFVKSNNITNFYSFNSSTAGLYFNNDPSNNSIYNALIADTPTGIRLSGIQNSFEFITINKTTTDAIAFADANVNATFKNSILAGCTGEGLDTSAAPTQLDFNYLANYSCKLGNVPKIYYNYSLSIYPFDKRSTNGNFYLNQSILAVDGGSINATRAISPDGFITLSSYYTAVYSEFGLVDLGYHYSIPAGIDTLNISLVSFDSSPNDNENINWSVFGTAYAGFPSHFYGNLTFDPQNTTISTGNCSIRFNDTEVVASFNSATGLYEYNRSFYEEGIYDWNLTCILSGEDKAFNNTDLTVYIPTNITYETSQFIGVGVGYGNITANFWRYDRNIPINGEINITMNGITKSCNATNCSKGWTVPTELPAVPAVYLINISIGNYSPFYTSANLLFNFTLNVIVPTTLTNETTIAYTGVNDAQNTHFNITSFFNRTDANLPIIGILNITLGNSTNNLSKVCYGQTNCSKGFRIGPTGDFKLAGNYTVYLTAWNDTAFYQQQNKTYIIYLEEPVAEGDLASIDKSITDFQVGTDYILQHSVTLQNHLESTMHNVTIVNTSLGGSPEVKGILNVSTTCGTVLPGESCTAVFNITIDGNVAGSGSQFNGPWFYANWTNNNGSVYSRLNDSMIIEVNPNPEFSLSQGTINLTRNLGFSNYTTITITNIGSETLGASGQAANSVFITLASGGTIPSSWVSFERAPSSNGQWQTDSCGFDCFSFINTANARNFIVNITPTYFYPGTYSGVINITAIKSGSVQKYHEINVSITLAPQITLSAESINITDNIGQNLLPNITINNTGNAPITWVNATFLPITIPSSWIQFDSPTTSFNTSIDLFTRIGENGSALLTLNITVLDFSEGIYTGKINVTTNESISTVFNLTINISPQLNVSPYSLLFNANLSSSPTIFLNLSALGNAPLTNVSINWGTNNLTSSWVSLNSTASSWNLTSSSFSRISEHTHSMLNVTMRLGNFTRGVYMGVINITTRENKNASINLTLDINPQLAIHNSSVSSHHGRAINVTLQINSTGNVKLINVTARFLNSSLSSDWTTLAYDASSGQTVTLGNISEGTSKFINVSIVLPEFQDPGEYSGLVNITADNEFYQTSNITVTVLTNSTWDLVDPINESKAFNLNEGGQIGNLTITNTGNIPLNFTVSYDTIFIMPGASQSCDSYKCIGISPISEGNLPFVHVPKNSTATIVVYHKSGGSSIARLNIGVNVTLFNASGTPITDRELFIFNVTDYPPILINLSTAPVGETGTLKNYTELNHSITLSAVISDDEINTTTRGMNFTSFYFNVTRPDGTRFFLNYSTMTITSDNQNDEIPPELERRHFNVTFANTSIQGVYNLSAYIRDKNNNVMASNLFQFEVIGKTTLASAGNQTNATSVSKTHNNTVTALINITNTGRATAYDITVNVTPAQSGWTSSLTMVGNLSESTMVQAEINITVPPATSPGSYSVTPVTFWTEPNGSQSSSSGTAFDVIVAANPEVNLTSVSLSSNLTLYAQHGQSYQFNITVNGTGNDDYRSATLYFINSSFSIGTVSFSSGSSSLHQISLGTIQVNELQNQTVYVSITSGTAPGSYHGEFVVNSSLYGFPRQRRINFTTVVAIDGDYTTTLTPIQSGFSLNEPGIIANLTISNLGNTEFSFVINYTNFSQTSYNNYAGLFNISQNNSDVLVNRNLSTLSPATSATFSIYQNGWFTSLQNVGILIALHNDSASPSTTTLNISFNITEMSPQASLLFPNGNSTEINNSLYIKVVGLDDAALNTTLSELNITYPDGTLVTINASNSSEFRVSNNNYIAMNFSTIFNATAQQGIYNITATVRDMAGSANSTPRAQFEVLGITMLTLASSNRSINITLINFTQGTSLILDINITNTGLTRAYALNLSGNLSLAAISWEVNHTFAYNLSSGTVLPSQLMLTIPAATPPGLYSFIPYISWREPNGSMSNISMVDLNITIASNKRTTFSNLTRNLSIHHGINHTFPVMISSIGNDNATTINLSMGNLPLTFEVSFNESIISQMNPGTNRSLELSVSPALGTSNGTYSFDVLLLNNNLLWENLTVNVTVPVNQSYNISHSALTINALRSQNDQNTEITLRSLANVPLAFTFDLSGEIVALGYSNLLNTSITLASLDTFGVPINYTGTSSGSYSGSLDVTFGSTTTIPIAFNVYLGNLTIVNVTPQNSILAGQNINLTSILFFSENAITTDTVFGAEINGSSCQIPTNISQGNYMVITCTAPAAADGRYHNVKLNANYSLGGSIAMLTAFNASLVYYRDITSPLVSLFSLADTVLGQNITITANATDNVAIDKVIAQITSPNGTVTNFTLGNHSTIYNISLNTSQYLSELGAYQLQLFANDTQGNLNNSALGSFSIHRAVVYEGTILDLSSRPYSVNFTFSNPSTPAAFYSNGSGNYSATIYSGNYDITMSYGIFTFKASNVSFFDQQTDFIDMDNLSSSDVETQISGALGGIAFNTSMPNPGSVALDYSSYSITDESKVRMYQCRNYSYGGKTCLGQWSLLSPYTLNTVSNTLNATISIFANTTSAFVLRETSGNTSVMELPNTAITFTINHSESASQELEIRSIGGADLTDIEIVCISGTACDNLGVITEFIPSIASSETDHADINITVPQYFAPGTYVGIMSIISNQVAETATLRVIVPTMNTFNATLDTAGLAVGSKATGTYGTLTIVNLGNVPLPVGINSSSNVTLSEQTSSIAIGASDAITVYYIAPEELGNYTFNVTINNTLINVSLNVTMQATIMNFTPSINVGSGDAIIIRANITGNGTAINESATWEASIDGISCSNLSSNFTIYWNISCTLPAMTDNITHTLRVAAALNSLIAYDDSTILYRDVFGPSIISFTSSANYSQDAITQINATTRDDNNLSNATVVMLSPTGASIPTNVSITNFTVTISANISEIGDYNITYTLYDNLSNSRSINKTFELIIPYNFSGNILRGNGSAVQNITFRLYRSDGTSIVIATNSSGGYSGVISQRVYNSMEINTSFNTLITLNQVNLTGVSDPFDIDELETSALTIPNSDDELVAFAVNTSLNNSGNLRFYYDGLGVNDPNDLFVFKCSNFSYSSRRCNTFDWEEQSGTVGFGYYDVSITGFSGYVLSETPEPTDSTTTTTTTTSSSGGGGGGGGGGATLTAIKGLLEKLLQARIGAIEGLVLSRAKIDLELFQGEDAQTVLSLTNENEGTLPLSFQVSDELSRFVSLSSSSLSLENNGPGVLILFADIPTNTAPKVYFGSLHISSKGVRQEVPIELRVLERTELQPQIRIKPIYSAILAGEPFRIQTEITNPQKMLRRFNLSLELIRTETNTVIIDERRSYALDSDYVEVIDLNTTENTLLGDYFVKATLKWQEPDGRVKERTSSEPVQVSKKPLLEQLSSFMRQRYFFFEPWHVLALILLLTAVALEYRHYRIIQEKKKKYHVQVDLNLLPYPTEHAGYIGYVAETNVRTFFDMDKLTTHAIIAGSTGGGKTVSTQVIVEEALKKGIAVVVFDPTAQWSGFLRKCDDNGMLHKYDKFGMKRRDSKPFNGNVHLITNSRELITLKDIAKPGEIHIFALNKMDLKEIDIFVANTVRQVFRSNFEESQELRVLLVYDEVHRLLPKYGGSGAGLLQIERACREFRKWGIGLMLISQVLSDFKGQIKANINTELQMRTRDESDLERMKDKYGEEMLQALMKANIGIGMVQNSEYNKGRPYLVEFRPLLHSPQRLGDAELNQYDKFNAIFADIAFEFQQLKDFGADVFDLELELKLATDKLKKGEFTVVNIYVEGLKPRIADAWKKINKLPKKREIILVSEKDIQEEIDLAQQEHKKALKVLSKVVKTESDSIQEPSKIANEDSLSLAKPEAGQASYGEENGSKNQVEQPPLEKSGNKPSDSMAAALKKIPAKKLALGKKEPDKATQQKVKKGPVIGKKQNGELNQVTTSQVEQKYKTIRKLVEDAKSNGLPVMPLKLKLISLEGDIAVVKVHGDERKLESINMALEEIRQQVLK